MKAKAIWMGALALVLVPLLAGCSSFHRKWRAALEEAPPESDIVGPWDGKWVSDKNGHNGRLRCIITRRTESDYDALFHAHYWKILRFSYTVPLSARRTETNFVFEGEADLGKLAGGRYSYEGSATPEEFLARYRSKYDHGRFEMSRPEGE